MAAFSSTEDLYHVMGALFARLAADPGIAQRLAEGALVVRFRWREPDGEATIDLRRLPIAFAFGASTVAADVEMSTTADTAHRFWLGRLNITQAIATRQLVARGSVPKALKLLPVLRPAFDLYPQVLRELGRTDLLPAAAEARPTGGWLAGAWQRLHPRRAIAEIDDAALNANLIPLVDALSEGSRPAASPLPASAESLVRREMLRRMLLIRAFEEHLSRAFAEGTVPTEAIHLSIGQEATAVGACFALRGDDTIVSTHRGHGHVLAKGADAGRMLAELYGKATGLCGGKGGPMHVTDAAAGVLGANGIVGASALIATGAALASRLAGDDRVSVAFLGDGATNQGMFHEAVNFAAVFDLPVVFVIENNQYGEFTRIDRHCRVARLGDRAVAYGISDATVDGNDADAVLAVMRTAVQHARGGLGPTLVECLTYRWHGHMEGEQARYRSDEEVAHWRALDPIARLRDRLLREGALPGDEAAVMALEAEAAVADAAAKARTAPPPPAATLATDVFAPELRVLYTAVPEPPARREVTCAEALREALAEEMRRDPRVFLLGEDVTQGGYFAVTAGLVEEFPTRVLDTPISENAIVGAAVGAAMCGMRPVAEILFSDFITCCMDPLVNQAAKLRYMSGGQYTLPLVVRTPGGGGLGMAAQHSQSLEAMLTGIPGLIVIAPATPRDAKGLLKAAIRSANPVVFFENKLGYLGTGAVPEGDCIVPIGVADVKRPGRDATVVAIGGMVAGALAAAETLAAAGVDVEVVDPRTLVPLDAAAIVRSVARTGRLVTVEEGHLTHGFGAEVIARVVEALPPSALKAPPRRVAALDVPIPYARNLERAAIPDEARIVLAVHRVMDR